MWRQLDRSLSLRLLLPLLPIFASLHRLAWPIHDVLTPEMLGALAIVLSARTIAERSLDGIMQVAFGFVPLVGGALVCGGAGGGDNPTWLGAVYYLGAGSGTVLAVLHELRERR